MRTSCRTLTVVLHMCDFEYTCAVQRCDGGPQTGPCDTSKSQEVDRQDGRDPVKEVHNFIKRLECKYIKSSGNDRCAE